MHSRFQSYQTDTGKIDRAALDNELDALALRYKDVRRRSLDLCKPLQIEDFGVQPMADASPPKWHLAHITWFFETFLLQKYAANYFSYHPSFEVLFNSYYNGVGDPFPREKRGTISRPTVAEIYAYRSNIDEVLLALISEGNFADDTACEIAQVLELGLHHEQQHQELLLTDIKYNLGNNPLFPSYHEPSTLLSMDSAESLKNISFREHAPGLVNIGAVSGFAFDNEYPRHQSFLVPFGIANRLVSNGEYLQFIHDGGYQRADLWLAQGWASLQETPRHRPLYWHQTEPGNWSEYRLDGLHPLQLDAPVTHISGYEAMAYAGWVGARLPTEFEWEWAAHGQSQVGNFADSNRFHPMICEASTEQFFGDVWEWTSSAYGPYPGFKTLEGVLGEYNGKFMSSQLVLRGGSCVTDSSHIRVSYRNFFYPGDRWQFSGIRLAVDL